jgi:hypothetical protein
MAIDRDRLLRIFDGLGQRLAAPTTICVIGSTPGIVSGQPDRQSQDIDVWRQSSDYDTAALARACEEIGVAFDPRGAIDPEAIYIQIIPPGIVKLPNELKLEVVGRFGALTVVMPEPALLAAAKLIRGEPRDLEDVAWWMKERALSMNEISAAIGALPDEFQREAAAENIVLVELLSAGERKPE